MTTTGLVLLWVIATIQPLLLVVVLLLAPAIRDHHRHWQKGTGMTDETEAQQAEPLGDHTRGFLIRRWIRDRYRYLRVRDERDAADRAGDYE